MGNGVVIPFAASTAVRAAGTPRSANDAAEAVDVTVDVTVDGTVDVAAAFDLAARVAVDLDVDMDVLVLGLEAAIERNSEARRSSCPAQTEWSRRVVVDET
jgi:hypothetical protein